MSLVEDTDKAGFAVVARLEARTGKSSCILAVRTDKGGLQPP